MDGYAVRKPVGDAHELRVAAEFRRCGWVTGEWGQAVLPVPVREALVASRSRWRYFPDLVAARGGEVVTVDAKDRLASATSDRYAVSRECVSFGLQFMAAFGLPVFYVFGDLRVLTPQEVMTFGTLGPRSHAGAYYLVSSRVGRGFSMVFGDPVAVAALPTGGPPPYPVSGVTVRGPMGHRWPPGRVAWHSPHSR